VQEITLTQLEAGQRLDRYLRKLLPAVPLGAIFRYLRRGDIRVDGEKARGELRLQAGMKVTLRLPEEDLRKAPPAAPREPAAGPADFDPFDLAPPPEPHGGAGGPPLVPQVVLRDDHVLVVDKPAGLAIHPGTGQSQSLVGWLATQRVGVRTATFAPAPAHRIDRGTSGLVIIGLVPEALRALTAAFRENSVHKVYYAVVHGVPQRPQGSIVAPLWQDPDADPRLAKVVVDSRGAAARTEYEVTRQNGRMALLRVVPETGRQHQIRAHLLHLGHPIVGDRRYGSLAQVGHGFLLHAAELTFPHPATGKRVSCKAPLPREFHRLFDPI
jgi:23S rRNA pseudouridine955/2504/2580 synthase